MALAGALVIILSGIFLPLSFLQKVGIPCFLTGIALIGLGLRSYRRLSRLQIKPHELHLNDHELLFLKQGRPFFRIPLASIEKISYFAKEREYGLALCLKKPLEEKIVVLQPRANFAHYVSNEGLMLPYFSERTVQELIEAAADVVDSDQT